MKTLGYVIVNARKDGYEYLALDRDSGGYPYWGSSFREAEIYKTAASAKAVLGGSDFARRVQMASGVSTPPTLLCMAGRLSNTVRCATVNIQVAPLQVGEPAHTERHEVSLDE